MMGSKKIRYEHLKNPKLSGTTTEEIWNNIKPIHKAMYRIIEDEPAKTAETPPEIIKKRKNENSAKEQDSDMIGEAPTE